MAIWRSQKLMKSWKQRRNASLKAQRGTERGLKFEPLEDRRLLAFGPQLQGVLPDSGSLLMEGDIRDVAPRELLFVFDEVQMLDPSTLSSAFELTRSGLDGVFGDGDDVVVTPGFIGLGESNSEVVMRFASGLVDDQYQLLIKGTGADALLNEDGYALNDTDGDGLGEDETLHFELDLGAQIVAVVPQPVSTGGPALTQARDQIVVYFNDDDLFVENDGTGAPTARSAENPDFYQLILTRDTVTNTDDVVFKPTEVSYDPATDRAVLTFAAPLDELAGPGTFRLRIGTDEAIPPVPVIFDLGGVEPGDTFASAVDVSGDFDASNASSILISQEIVSTFVPLAFPGAVDEPGMRNVPLPGQGPYNGGADGLGIPRAFYNFRDFYGIDPEGNVLKNQITENQKQRTREIFELYGAYLGLDFIESADLGLTIVTGDMRALDPTIPTGPGGVAGLAGGGRAIMDAGETWNDRYGGNWFQVGMHEIGHLLGLGHVNELAPVTIMNDEPILEFDNPTEPDFPGDYDIMHGQHLWRPENNDIDLYTFDVAATGLFTAETLAERLPNASLLDTNLKLYKQTASGVPVLMSANNDYFSQDSYLELELEPGTYFIGVAANGNDKYDPTIEDSGVGGTSTGQYDLRLTFRPGAVRSITDNDNRDLGGTALDGDLNGTPGGTYNFWFRSAAPKGETAGPTDPHTIFVDKGQTGSGDGTLASPYGDLPTAVSNARPNDIIRVVGNGGADGDITTLGDNLAYEIGFGTLQGNTLSDGAALVVPQRVTLMVDEGAIFKLRDARISVGSTTLSNGVDVSAGAIQLLGTPDQQVIMTSYLNEDIGLDTNPHVTVAEQGDWGGILIRNDLDRSENRFLWDKEGIFLNYVNHVDFTYGGGNVRIDGVDQVVNPVSMIEAQPTISFNTISLSADAALSADPNSFRELNFHSPFYQKNTPFTSDYTRVGPDIDWNTVVDNSTNGLFVRVRTPSGSALKPQTVTGRWDDTDITHVLGQTLIIQGTPGGLINEQDLPPSELVTLTAQAGGQLDAGFYNYRLVFLDANDNESLPSLPTETEHTLVDDQRILLQQLPPAPAGFVARRLYRSDNTGNPNGEYRLIATLDASDTTYVDQGLAGGGLLDLSNAPTQLNRARLDASLTIDPGTIVKLEGARIEVGMGAQLLAEGLDGQRVIFTSKLDDRFGASGSFDTNNDVDQDQPSPGNWSGVFASPLSTVSFDHSLFTYGGGITPVEGSFAGFNVLEIHQADARVTNSIFEYNAVGTGGFAPSHRFGRGFNEASTIFVRAAQPVIVNNIIRRGDGPALSVNANALNYEMVRDLGRQSGLVDIATTVIDNQGPLVKGNSVEKNAINGLVVRGETMSTQGVWDDTDIVHVLFDTVYVADAHIYGGLRLESKPTESLVVKLDGPTAGFTATGRPLDIDDRIGGALQIVGQPGSAVVLTSLSDDTKGAGFRASDGQPQTDTNNDGNASTPAPGDWNRILIDQYSHDRNVETILEREPAGLAGPGINATPETSQALGELARHEKDSDENLRLGFEVHGTLGAKTDRDVYSFAASAGTEVWIDIDRTEHALDTVVELIGADGTVLARSDNSFAESNQLELIFAQPLVLANSLQKSAFLQGKDAFTTNPRDAGLRLVLPGTVGSEPSLYYVRVRSSSPDLSDLNGGLTTGRYQLQIRLSEINEVAGSTIRYADIRYATTGVDIRGQVIHSPLAGESSEGNDGGNNAIGGAQVLGNLLNTDRAALSIGGTINNDNDVDFYEFEIAYDSVQSIAGYSAGTFLSTIFDLDYSDQFGRSDASLYVFDEDFNLVLSSSGVSGSTNSSIAEDQPKPLEGADVDDLSRGSAGTLDPFIGTQSLPAGVYYLAVTNANRMPQEMEQFVQAAPSNPLLRLEPINSIVRLVEDRIGSSGGSNIANGPILPQLIDVNTGAVPFTLGDVTLFIGVDGGLSAGYAANVQTVDPFTGAVETRLGNVSQGGTAPFIGDIAMRYDGELFSFSQGYIGVARDDNTVGNVLQIDTGTADYTSPGDDGITTWEPDADANEVQSNVGVYFDAITFAGNGPDDLYAVGYRGDAPNAPVEFDTNILYRFNTDNGVATSIIVDRTGCPTGGNECRYNDAGTQIRERGQIITQAGEIVTVDATDPAAPWDNTLSIQDGTQVTVRADEFPPETRTYEFDTGPEVEVTVDQLNGLVIRDSQFMILDGDFFQFDTGYSLVVPADTPTAAAGSLLADGLWFRLTDNQGVPFTVEFNDVTSGPGGDGIASQFAIDYTVDMTQVELQQQIVTVINNLPFNIVAAPIGSAPGLVTVAFVNESRVDLFGQITIDTQSSPLTTLLQDNPGATGAPQRLPVVEDTILIPDAGYVDGLTWTISDGQTTLVFEFEDLDIGDGLLDPTAVAINFDTTTTAQDIADQIVQAFVDNDVRLLPTLDAVTFPGQVALHVKTAVELSGELGDAPIWEAPRGAVITDGQVFQINTVYGSMVFEYDQIGGPNPGVAAGNVPLYYSPFDNPVAVATAVTDAINDFTSVEATQTGQYVVMNGQQREMRVALGGADAPAPGVLHVTLEPTSAFYNNVRNLWNFVSNDSDPPTFDEVEGFLAGFNESQTMPQVQQQLAQELNIARSIEDASNPDPGRIVIDDVDDHTGGLKTGDSVIVRGVGGQVYANGLFDIRIVDADQFELVGTELRDNRGQGRFDYTGGGVYLNYEASSLGVRTNFLGANDGMFDAVPIFADQGTQGGSSFNTTRIPLQADDLATDVANTLAFFINREFFPNATAVSQLDRVTLNNLLILNVDPPLTATGSGEGGMVKGIAIVNGAMYAVDDAGGLYMVDNYQGTNALDTTHVKTFFDDFGANIEFAGLSVGPQQVEGGIYSNLLFGVTRSGEIMAFDTDGELQAVFNDGATSVNTGVNNVNGLAFSNLDINLWHVSGNRGNDAGHGVQVPVDNSRLAQPGGQSFYFGFQGTGPNNWSALNPGNANDYDFPGGAHGTLVTDPFSLSGYSAADDPVLYFNYFLETEGTDYNPDASPREWMRDSFRVYIADEAGDWHLLATNNSFRDNNRLDEFELGDGAIPSAVDEVYSRRGVQELYDNTGTWRQARVQLGPWAGQDNLFLKFEFATAGSIDLGGGAGVQITGVAAEAIVDGDLVVVDGALGAVPFEFDLGHLLVAQAASNITEGSQFIVNGDTYEFNLGGAPPVAPIIPIFLNVNDDALAVATQVRNALLANGNVVESVANRINLPALPNVGDVQLLGDGLIQTGVPGVTGANRPMMVTLEMNSADVATVVRQALEDEFAAGNADGYQAVKIHNDTVVIVGHDVLVPGPLRVFDAQDGDQFGAFNISGPPQVAPGYAGSLRGMDNAHEGAYIDDLIIGFAERGELITNAAGNAAYRDNPYVPDFSTLLGTYQVEVRRGPEYGEPDGNRFLLTRAFGTDDRLTHAISLVAPAANEVHDGQQFHISDGINTVIFEYDDVDLGNGTSIGDGVTSGVVAVPFDATSVLVNGDIGPETSIELAARIRNLINSSQVQAVIDVTAQLADGAFGGSSNVIDLIGTATGTVDPTSDRVFPTFNFGDIGVIAYGVGEHTMVGDSNLFRDQGQLLVHSNLIRDSLQYGIIADAGARNRADLVPMAGTLPHAGPVRNLRVQNLDRLVPGPVLENNVISGSGTAGILISGDSNAGSGELASVAFTRAVNNTIYGTGSGVGISVTENAAPTILNSIIANVGTGLAIDGSSTPNTELGGMLFQNVGTLSSNGQLGAFPIVLGSNEPLFVDPANDNFQLEAFSKAIDSSVDSLEDRQDLVFVKDPLEISESPILAPELDVFGQKRIDDASVNTPAGQGENVFKDRGAIDRVDFTGLVAILANPLDNDVYDSSDVITFVATKETLDNFSILLTDTGTGPDDNSVNRDNVTLLRDGVTLVAGVDFSFAYDPTSNTIRLKPIAGIWPSNRQFEIDLANDDRTTLSFVNSTPADGALLTITDSENPANVVEFEYDTGFVLRVPLNGGADIADGETFTLTHGNDTVVFEFDNDDDYDDQANERVAFTDTSTRREVANAIVAAINASVLALNPVNVGAGQVHIGGDDTTLLDTANTALTQTGQPGLVSTTALPIAIVPRMYSQIASSTAAAIAGSGLVGVTAEPFGSEVFLTGTAAVDAPQLTVKQVQAIQDLAGNNLQANRADSTTRFTVLTGLGVDYGDAPSQYPVLKADDGASHEIVEGYHLGPEIIPSGDGQPSPNADADTGDDGVAFTVMTAGYEASIDVTASGITAGMPGFLDAWIDYNSDGDWDDVGEQIFASKVLANGANQFTFTVKSILSPGDNFARFRFSSTGGLSPTGPASDGEVEDYRIDINGNPWHNYANPNSTNGDIYVSPVDALLVIHLLNFSEDMGIDLSKPLPVPPLPGFEPPPYYDVNGDSYVSPIDALLIIGFLNSGGEGEGEGEGSMLASSSSSSLVVDNGLTNSLEGGLWGSVLSTNSSSQAGASSSLASSPLVASSNATVSQPLLTGIAPSTATDSRGWAVGTDFQSEDLEELLNDIADDGDELAALEGARDDFFASLGS